MVGGVGWAVCGWESWMAGWDGSAGVGRCVGGGVGAGRRGVCGRRWWVCLVGVVWPAGVVCVMGWWVGMGTPVGVGRPVMGWVVGMAGRWGLCVGGVFGGCGGWPACVVGVGRPVGVCGERGGRRWEW